MCIIIDTNRLGTFLHSDNEDSVPIHKWLKKNGTLIYSTGGKFKAEIGQKAKNKLLPYHQAGMAKHIPHHQFAEEEHALEGQTALQSNDIHILALARSTGARLLYTSDKNLIQDFKNRKFIDQPRGKVYSGKRNADLLNKSGCRT